MTGIGRVEVVRWLADSEPAGEDAYPDAMGPAAARHARPAPGMWRRAVTAGQDALAESSAAIALQVDAVAERMLGVLAQQDHGRQAGRVESGAAEPLWRVNEVEVSFGVQLTGEASVAVFSGSVETSAQIVLTFTRTPVPGADQRR